MVCQHSISTLCALLYAVEKSTVAFTQAKSAGIIRLFGSSHDSCTLVIIEVTSSDTLKGHGNGLPLDFAGGFPFQLFTSFTQYIGNTLEQEHKQINISTTHCYVNFQRQKSSELTRDLKVTPSSSSLRPEALTSSPFLASAKCCVSSSDSELDIFDLCGNT